MNDRSLAFRSFLILVIAFCLLTYVHEAARTAVSSEYIDFGNYYFYAKALRLHYPIYTLNEQTLEVLRAQFAMPPFVHPSFHPPVFFLLFRSITFFGYRTAALLWLLLNNLLLTVSVAMLISLAVRHMKVNDKLFFTGSILFLVTSFQPLLATLILGQVNLFILFSFALGLYLIDRNKQGLAGAAFAVGVLIKPHLALILLFFLWKRRFRLMACAAATMAVLQALSVCVNGAPIELYYWTSGLRGFFRTSVGDLSSVTNYSLPALFHRVFSAAPIPVLQVIGRLLAGACSAGILACTAYVSRHRFGGINGKFLLEFGLVSMTPSIIFILVHEHHYVLLFIPLIFAWAALLHCRQKTAFAAFAVAFLLVGLKYTFKHVPAVASGLPSLLSGLKTYGVVTLFLLAAWLHSKRELWSDRST